jgi:hypothetical protein
LNEGGDIYLQAQSIQIAAQDIKRNGVRLSNLKREIEIENERYGKERGAQDLMKRIVVRYGSEQAALTERIGQIEADQLAWEKGTEAATSFLDNGLGEMVESKGTSLITGALSAGIQAVNAKMQYDMELKKGKLKADKERRAADEKAEILDAEGLVIDADHQATVKRLLLQMSEIAVDSAESALVLQQEQARLTALFDTWQALETRRDRVLANLSQRYFADPIHRLRMDTSLVRAERSFKDAQKWVFFLARSLEYEWNTVFSELPGGGHNWLGDNYSVDSVYRARNTPDLQNIVAALKDYNSSTQSIVVGARQSWFSLRDDFFGLGGDDVAFRARLQQLIASDPDGKLILDFSTARDLGPAYPLYGADGWNDKIDTIRVHAVGLGGPVSGLLSYGGNGFIRNQNYGTSVPGSPDLVVGEERTYASRYWFFDTIADDWTFTDDQRAQVQVYPATSPKEGGITPPSTPIQDFQQRSVAATGWVLELPAGIDLSQVTDIELFIEHRSATRQ